MWVVTPPNAMPTVSSSGPRVYISDSVRMLMKWARCACGSMPPGRTRRPLASMTSCASVGCAAVCVSETILPALTPTSQVPLASGPTTSPPRTKRSSMSGGDSTRATPEGSPFGKSARRGVCRRLVVAGLASAAGADGDRGNLASGRASKDILHGLALLGEPVVQDAHVPADAEMLDAHLEIARGAVRVADLGPGGDTALLGCLDDELFRVAHTRMPALAGETDAHRIVGRAELDHIDARDVENSLKVF